MAAEKQALERRVEQLRTSLSAEEPESLARRTMTSLQVSTAGDVQFSFPYWRRKVVLPIKDYIARDPSSNTSLPMIDQAMIAYYFHDSQGSGPPQGWISFSELPDGQFYASAYQGYTAKKIRQHFSRKYSMFDQAARYIGGEPVSFASGAFRLQILPKVSALMAYWKGDADIPPSYQILFEDTVPYHIPTDACAILGSMITAKLIKAKEQAVSFSSGKSSKRPQGQDL